MGTRHRLPHLSAIRAFEAAAQHLSFTAASEELNITQSAVSHQIRNLEEFLGRPLFRRTGNRVELTAAGRAYQRDVTAVLDELDASTQRLTGRGRTGPLAIRGTPAFIARWLVPRFDGFRARHPGIDWDLSTGLPPTDFRGGDLDIVIHWGTEPVAGVRVEPFLGSTRFPVASPALLARIPIRRPSDLARATLLHNVVGDGWEEWLDQVGAAGFDHARGPRFEHCELSLTAAERGQGVALAYGALIGRDLAEGRLVRLFDAETEAIFIYSLATEESRADCPRIEAFRDWLLGEVAAEPGAVMAASDQAAE